MTAWEVNFDGIVGPTHNYAGLSYGNVASQRHQHEVSRPREAALQGLEKMRFLDELGVRQAVLPPFVRPHVAFLRRLGFCGSDRAIVKEAGKVNPALLAASYSAAGMWTANAATVSPSADCRDGRVHLTPANLSSTLHRAIDAEPMHRLLEYVFADGEHFRVHPPIPPYVAMTDEGAANHTRLCAAYDQAGIELFTFGRFALDPSAAKPNKYPARQTREASQAIARHHELDLNSTRFAQQSPAAIDSGVFHNDVISVGNQHVLLIHQRAYVDQESMLAEWRELFAKRTGCELIVIEIGESMLPLADAVASYLFNSQLVTLDDGKMALICPRECREIQTAQRTLNHILAGENPIVEARDFDLRQSMRNGGGPACLRLRVVLTTAELNAIHQPLLFDPSTHERLGNWIDEHYREELCSDELVDPALARESHKAINELASLLAIPVDLLIGGTDGGALPV